MKEFDFVRPSTVEQACEILSAEKAHARIIAGGTDLLVDLRAGKRMGEDMRLVVDITGLQELREIKRCDGRIHIGALVTHAEVAASELLQSAAPFLTRACDSVGSPQIRNRGTIGGNLCNASPAGDSIVPLMALDARVVLRSAASERILPLTDFIAGAYRTHLHDDEMLVGIDFEESPQARTAFTKLGRRKALAVARMSVAVLAEKENGIITKIRIAAGAVMAGVQRMQAAEELMTGKTPDKTLIAQAAKAVSEEMIQVSGRRWSTDFKEPVVQALVTRTLGTVLEVE